MNVNDTTAASTRTSLLARLNDTTNTVKVPRDPTAAPAPAPGPAPDAQQVLPQQSIGSERLAFPALDAGTVHDAVAEDAAPQSLTVQGLMDAWGQKGTEYDLDGDGRVGMNDLTSLLAQLAQGNNQNQTRGLGPGFDEGARGEEFFNNTVGDEELVGDDLTVDGLMEAWGSRNEMYDLDGNGQVGMADLIQLLSQAENAEGSAIPRGFTNTFRDVIEGPGFDASLPAEEDGAPSLSIPGLFESWGQKSEDYDLDGDGVVGMGDLVELLSRLNASDRPDGAGARIGTEVNGQDLGSTLSDPELTVDGLRDAWGERGGMYDLNGDGQVGMADLIELLSRQSEPSSGASGDASGAISAGPPDETANDPKIVQQMLERMLDKFRSSGFVDAPPSNLHEIVGGLDLTDAQQHALMNGIEQAYPQGLGLSMLA